MKDYIEIKINKKVLRRIIAILWCLFLIFCFVVIPTLISYHLGKNHGYWKGRGEIINWAIQTIRQEGIIELCYDGDCEGFYDKCDYWIYNDYSKEEICKSKDYFYTFRMGR